MMNPITIWTHLSVHPLPLVRATWAPPDAILPEQEPSPPVPPLSDFFGTHQHSKNAKLRGLFVQLRMSSKLRNRVTSFRKVREI